MAINTSYEVALSMQAILSKQTLSMNLLKTNMEAQKETLLTLTDQAVDAAKSANKARADSAAGVGGVVDIEV